MSTPEFTPTPPTPTLPACPVSVPAHLLALRTAKVRDHHLDRKAIVYIRQSSPQQVAEHKESTARQYALADVAVALGWPRERVGAGPVRDLLGGDTSPAAFVSSGNAVGVS